MIITLGGRFVTDGFADMSITAADSTAIYAMNQRVWHKSSIKEGMVPHHGIDTDARWGFARTKGWVFGYKLHMSCSTGNLAVPLSAHITGANVYDNQAYHSLIEPLQNVRYVVADAGYDDHKLYDHTRQKGIRLICPIRRYRRTKGERLKLIEFYKSEKGQRIYKNRSISVEPLFQCIKDAFGISVAPVRGFENVQSYVMMCVFVYQIAAYYNCVMGSDNPRYIKRMLGN